MPDSDLQTKIGCDRKYRLTLALMTIFVAMAGLTTAGVAWAVSAGNSASRAIEIHQARQNGTLEKIDDHLFRIDQRLERIEEKQP